MKAFHYTDREQIDAIIDRSTVCFVAMAHLSGEPYLLPMNFVYFEGAVYLHSATEGSHLKLLAENNQVCLCFCEPGPLVYQSEQVACSHSMRADSVLIWGRVEFVESAEEKIEIFHALMKRFVPNREFTYSAPSITHTQVWRIQPERISAKAVGLTYEEYKKLNKEA